MVTESDCRIKVASKRDIFPTVIVVTITIGGVNHRSRFPGDVASRTAGNSDGYERCAVTVSESSAIRRKNADLGTF